jgi:hypothetical protein
MTNPPLPDDELASALVDGLGDDQERARLTSDPALAARVEQLRAVRRAVAASMAATPPSAEARERAIAAAMAAATPQESSAPERPAHALPAQAPVDLDARRNGRTSWLPAAAAAAVVVVLGLGAFAALRDRGTEGDSQVTAAEPPATTLAGAGDLQRESTFDAAGTTPAAGATTTATARSGQDTGGAGPSTTAAPPAAVGGAPAPTAASDGLPDLGSLDEADALRAALAALPAAADGAGTEAASCATVPTGRLVARLTWVGQPALVVVDDGPPSRAVVVTAAECYPLAEVALP